MFVLYLRSRTGTSHPAMFLPNIKTGLAGFCYFQPTVLDSPRLYLRCVDDCAWGMQAQLVFAKPTAGVAEVEPSMLWNPSVVSGIGSVADPAHLYQDMHTYLASSGALSSQLSPVLSTAHQTPCMVVLGHARYVWDDEYEAAIKMRTHPGRHTHHPTLSARHMQGYFLLWKFALRAHTFFS